MLHTYTLEKLRALRLEGLVQALEEQRRQPDLAALDFEDRLALLWRSLGLEPLLQPHTVHSRPSAKHFLFEAAQGVHRRLHRRSSYK